MMKTYAARWQGKHRQHGFKRGAHYRVDVLVNGFFRKLWTGVALTAVARVRKTRNAYVDYASWEDFRRDWIIDRQLD